MWDCVTIFFYINGTKCCRDPLSLASSDILMKIKHHQNLLLNDQLWPVHVAKFLLEGDLKCNIKILMK